MSLQDLRINTNESITGICVVAEKSKCPSNYQIIDKTLDDGTDADLWKDSIFTVWKGYRYLCICRQPIQDGLDTVVESFGIIAEKDLPPLGFTMIDDTVDTKEKATKKHTFVVKTSLRNLVNMAVNNIAIISKGKKISSSFCFAGEMGGLQVYFQVGAVTRSRQHFRIAPPLPYALGGYSDSQVRKPSYPVNPMDSPHKSNGYQGTMEATWFPSPNISRPQNAVNQDLPSPSDQSSVLFGIPFQISSKLTMMLDCRQMPIPKIPYKSLIDVENEFSYNFHLEKTATTSFSD